MPSGRKTFTAEAASANLTADALPDRWVAVLEAVAFSPIRSQVVAAAAATQVSEELTATVKRLGALLPQIAALYGITVDAKAAQPKPLRPTRPAAPAKKKPAAPAAKPAAPAAAAPAEQAAPVEAPAAVEAPVETAAEVPAAGDAEPQDTATTGEA